MRSRRRRVSACYDGQLSYLDYEERLGRLTMLALLGNGCESSVAVVCCDTIVSSGSKSTTEDPESLQLVCDAVSNVS